MTELPNDGERYLASAEDPEISYEHWHRYLWAAEFAANRTVLDIACGEGYGSRLLAQRARSVQGVDLNPQAVAYAREHYPDPKLTFEVGAVDAIPVAGRRVFDLIVSFETLEHVAEPVQKKFLTEVKRLLKPGGLFLVSTPNQAKYSDEPKFKNPFHVKEFYEEEFRTFLKGYFKRVALLRQKVYPVSYLWSEEDARGRLTEYRLRFTPEGFRPTTEPKWSVYALALASDRGLPRVANSLLVDVSDKFFERQAKIVAVLQQQAQDLKLVGEALRQKEGQIATLGEQLRQLDAACREWQSKALGGKRTRGGRSASA